MNTRTAALGSGGWFLFTLMALMFSIIMGMAVTWINVGSRSIATDIHKMQCQTVDARNHPATRTFQAIRMVVNDELGQLERFLDAILPRLAVGGRLAIITFHSLEDRIVKQRFRDWSTDCLCPPHLPRCVCNHHAEVKLLTKKPIVPSRDELAFNPRSGSAKLRVIEKLPPFC